jgi:hypothetical protein
MSAPVLASEPTAPSAALPDEPRATCWPNERETLLLQAGLWAPARALTAWDRFCASVPDIEALDDGCYRLFPLVAANLQSCGNDIPHRNRIFSVLRHSWVKTQRLLGQMLPFLRGLHTSGIDFLVLKGTALASLYQRQGSVRPMADIDILIRPHHLQNAAAILGRLGCASSVALTTERLFELIRYRHELTFRIPDGSDLDVHWYLISDARDLNAEDSFWNDSIPCTLPGLSTRMLHPTDQLLHTCLHGVQWNEVSPVRWLADATVLIRAGIDWNRLETQARRLRQLQPVRATLLYLNQLEIDLPSGVAQHWRSIGITSIENLEGAYRTAAPNVRERTRQLAWVYLRLTRNMPLSDLVRNLPGYMNQIHHFRSYGRRLKFICYLAYLFLSGKRARL